MRIAVDARELCGRPAGVGRYLSELLTEWAGLDRARRHEWTLLAHEAPRVPGGFLARVEVVTGRGGTAWEQWHLPRALQGLKPDLLFAPGYTAPLRPPCPLVLTVHDVSFCAHPGWFSAREGWRRRTLTRASARRAVRVITDSQFSAGEITKHLGVPVERIRTIPLGMRRQAPAVSDDDREPLVLYVGSMFERRNVDALIAAFAASVVPAVPAARLEIVGENRLRDRGLLDRTLAGLPGDARGRIVVRPYVDEAALQGLYRRATVFAFPSEYEGFGLTPLEALAAGVPPVVLDTPVAREVYGAAASYVPGRHGPALGRALAHLLTSASARRDLLQHAPAVLSRYDWSRAAAATLAALEESAGA
jgi:glycosyltransferase involved in cell wall biosynthesis